MPFVEAAVVDNLLGKAQIIKYSLYSAQRITWSLMEKSKVMPYLKWLQMSSKLIITTCLKLLLYL